MALPCIRCGPVVPAAGLAVSFIPQGGAALWCAGVTPRSSPRRSLTGTRPRPRSTRTSSAFEPRLRFLLGSDAAGLAEEPPRLATEAEKWADVSTSADFSAGAKPIRRPDQELRPAPARAVADETRHRCRAWGWGMTSVQPNDRGFTAVEAQRRATALDRSLCGAKAARTRRSIPEGRIGQPAPGILLVLRIQISAGRRRKRCVRERHLLDLLRLDCAWRWRSATKPCGSSGEVAGVKARRFCSGATLEARW